MCYIPSHSRLTARKTSRKNYHLSFVYTQVQNYSSFCMIVRRIFRPELLFPRKNIPELGIEFVIENKASYFFKNVQVRFVWYLFDVWFLIFIGLLYLCTIMAKSAPKVYVHIFSHHSYFEFSGKSNRAVNFFVFRHLWIEPRHYLNSNFLLW